MYNDKDYYLKKIKCLDADQQRLLTNQINTFFNTQNLENKNINYKIGDKVKLNPNTLIHGVRTEKNYIDVLQSIKKFGIISRTFITDNTDWKINYCVSCWHIKKRINLADYIKLYSGMTVKTELKENVLVPYGEFDNFMKSLINKDYKYIFAEHSMENTFLPSLAKNVSDKQLALILASKTINYQNTINNNLLSGNIPTNVLLKFFHQSTHEKIINKINNSEYDRIAYIPFGIPSSFIEGILVGRKIENNKTFINKIKLVFPNCYICNLDGIVIG